jgi:hypothetical protein
MTLSMGHRNRNQYSKNVDWTVRKNGLSKKKKTKNMIRLSTVEEGDAQVAQICY